MVPFITNAHGRSRSMTAPPAARMPHVFVIPPEEEQQENPPWCCFDADEQPDNNGDFPSAPDIHFNDVPYLLQQTQPSQLSQSRGPTPIYRRTTVHGCEPQPKKLEKKQRPEAVKIIENKPIRRESRADSDVVEVVKVKRGKEALTDPEDNTKVKRTKTFKARATKALQSIKNVGKNSRRTHVKELWTSTESMPGIFKGMQEQILLQQERMDTPGTPTKKESFPRRSLSQIFHVAKPSRPESPFPARVASPTPLTDSPYVLPSSTSSSFAYQKGNVANPSVNEARGSLTVDDALDRPASPSPSMKKTPRRFSVLELHKLFSFSSSSPDDPSVAVPFTPARNGSVPSTSTSTSTMSSDYPDVPVEEGLYASAHFFDLGGTNRKLAPQYYEVTHTQDADSLSTPRRPHDLSFEMRLDSLHFDSLSFDPEDFDVPMEGNFLR